MFIREDTPDRSKKTRKEVLRDLRIGVAGLFLAVLALSKCSGDSNDRSDQIIHEGASITSFESAND